MTFTNDRGKLNLILHQNKENLFKQLEINNNFSFSGHKGKKNYLFINPQSIKLVFQPFKTKGEVKIFYFNQLLKNLGISQLSNESLSKKLEQLKTIRQNLKEQADDEYFLT